MGDGEAIRTGGGVEKGDFADDVGKASNEEGECARCEWGVDGVVEWDLGDELGDEAGVGLGGVDAVLEEVESETVTGEGEGSSGDKEWMGDGGGVGSWRCQRVQVVSQFLHRGRCGRRNGT